MDPSNPGLTGPGPGPLQELTHGAQEKLCVK